MRETYRSESYGSRCQPDKASISGVWLMDLVGIVVTELADDSLDPIVIVRSQTLSYEILEVQRSTLAFVV